MKICRKNNFFFIKNARKSWISCCFLIICCISVAIIKDMTNKTATFIIVALFLCVSSVAQEKVSYQRDYRYLAERIEGVYIPKDIDEAVDSLDVIISSEDKRHITDSLSLDDFRARCHFGLGMWMRNNWGLWGGSRLQRYFLDRKVTHPDDMSDQILKTYYKKKIQGLDYSIEDDIEPNPGNYEVRKIGPLRRFWVRLKQNMNKDVRKTRRELKKGGYAKGKTVYFMYPYGCSTEEEDKISLELYDDNFIPLPKGKITDIDYVSKRIKVKLIDTISPYGIIVFDGDLQGDEFGKIERDFDTFIVNSPNRFYMKPGNELWFDLKSEFWDSGKKKGNE